KRKAGVHGSRTHLRPRNGRTTVLKTAPLTGEAALPREHHQYREPHYRTQQRTAVLRKTLPRCSKTFRSPYNRAGLSSVDCAHEEGYMASIGIIGCGAIGRALLRAADDGRLPVSVAGVTSRSEAPARSFLGSLSRPVPYLSLPQLVEASDLLIEAAGAEVV